MVLDDNRNLLKIMPVVTLLCVIIILIMNAMRSAVVSNTVKETLSRRHRFDYQNFPICGKIGEIEQELTKEEHHPQETINKYRQLLMDDLMHCGYEKPSSSWLSYK